MLEAANRCARALGSSLELDEAFGAFIRELRGLVPFERTAIVLVEGDTATTMATAGRGANEVFPPGNSDPIEGSLLERVLEGKIVVRRDLEERGFPEDEQLLALGLRSELVDAAPARRPHDRDAQPLARPARRVQRGRGRARLAARPPRRDRRAEHPRLRGRAATRRGARAALGAPRRLRLARLPRAAQPDGGGDRRGADAAGPLADADGAEQRESFLALIGDETTRLAELVGDVLDTSRIEAGTFSYRFEDVDLGRVVDEAVEAAVLAQQDVPVVASVRGALPAIRGDRARLRQVLGNLIDNAVKYSPEGGEVRVSAGGGERRACGSRCATPGRGSRATSRRASSRSSAAADVPGGSKPGTGLGLFIARSIAEAHGGTLDVSSGAEPGSTFTLTLPVGG